MYVGKTLFAQVMEIVPWTSCSVLRNPRHSQAL